MRFHRIAATLVALALSCVVLVACGGDDEGGGGAGAGGETQAATQPSEAIRSNPDNAGVSITVGSKNFTEQKVLGEIYAQALAAAGYEVQTELNLGDEKTALKALQGGDIDAYPEYTGTALTSFFDVKPQNIPDDEQQAYQQAREGFAEEGLTALPPTPFTSSNEVAVTQETAQEHGLSKISDLAKVDDQMTLYGSPECRQRTDCLLGLQQVYGLDFQRFVPVAIELRHEVLKKGQADVSIVFTTDPQNKREKFVLLEDDKNMFPPYNSTFVVRDETMEKAGPDLEQAIVKAQKPLTDEVMQELNARVDLDKKTPREVAREYLRETGLIE